MNLPTKNPQLILPDGTNPYAYLNAAELLFDQSKLPEDQRTFPLLQFQRTALILKALYRYTQLAAPSQSGKTTVSALLAATTAYMFPGSMVLFMSAIADQAERVLEACRDQFIKCAKVEDFRKLSTDSTTELQLACNGSIIKAVPYSIKALTGNPAKLVILDEMAKFTREPATLYAEAIARGGRTSGSVFSISTLFGKGKADPKSPQGYTGNYYHYLLQETMKRKREPNKNAVAAMMTYHVSPYLVQNIEVIREGMMGNGKNRAYFNEHYLCIPRENIGQPVFGDDFSPPDHVRPDAELVLSQTSPLFVSFDPGLTKACVVGQVDLERLQLVYLRAYKGGADETWHDFVKKCWAKIRRDFPGWPLDVHCDVAGRKRNDQTLDMATDVIFEVTGQAPYTQYQNIEPGIQVLRSFMRRRNGFYVSKSTDCRWLVEAFSHGLVYKEVNGVAVEAWDKDGEYEHVGDAARYPVYSIMNGRTADTPLRIPRADWADNSGMFSVNPYTGY